MQKSGRGPRGETAVTSDSIWSTLRMTTSFLRYDDAHHAADKRDLDTLNRIFNISEWSNGLPNSNITEIESNSS